MRKILLLFLLISGFVQAQVYNMRDGLDITTCGGMFYDSGGPTQPYRPNENLTMVFRPGIPGSYIGLQFSNLFSLEGEPSDFLTIYNGSAVDPDHILAIYGDESPRSCRNGLIRSSDPLGCLTVVFKSNNSTQYAGWAAAIACSAVPGNNDGPPINSVCDGAMPICANPDPLKPTIFENTTSDDCADNTFGVVTENSCLLEAPNPAWHFIKIDNAGDVRLGIDMNTIYVTDPLSPLFGTATGTPLDVDFAIWGPFATPDGHCDVSSFSAGPIDCGFTEASSETATITAAAAGSYYLILVTNYNDVPGFIKITQINPNAPTAGATDCCPIITKTDPLCGGSNGSIGVATTKPNTVLTVTYLDDGVPVTVTETTDARGEISIAGLNAGNYTNILTDFDGCNSPTNLILADSSNLVVSSVTVPNTPFCVGSTIPFTIRGTANATVTFNINGAANRTVVLNASGIAIINNNNSQTPDVTLTVTKVVKFGCSRNLSVQRRVTVTAPPTVALAYANSPYCSSSTTIRTPVLTGRGSYTGGTYSALPSGLSLNSTTGAINPAASTANTYTITYTTLPAGGCGTVTATATIRIDAAPTLVSLIYNSSSYCSSSALRQLPALSGTGDFTGGTYSIAPSGLNIDPVTGAFYPNQATINQAYTITYEKNSVGCAVIRLSATIAIFDAPTISSFNYVNFPYCASSAVSRLPQLHGTGGYLGGTFSATPAGLDIDPVSGAVRADRSTPSTQPYEVTYNSPATGGCVSVSERTNVTISAAPTISELSYGGLPYCVLSTTPQLPNLLGTGSFSGGIFTSTAGLVIDRNTGAILPNLSTPDDYEVTYTSLAASNCGSISITTPVRIIWTATLTRLSYGALPFCNSLNQEIAPTLQGTGAYTGGTFTAAAALHIDPQTGAINPSLSEAGIYMVTYKTSPVVGCSEVTITETVEITNLPTVTAFSYPANRYCNTLASQEIPQLTGTGNYNSGTFSATPTGLSIDANTGILHPNLSQPGNYNIKYTTVAGGGCDAVSKITIVDIILPPTIATFNYPERIYCNSVAQPQLPQLAGTLDYSGGSYSVFPSSGLTVDPVTGSFRPLGSSANTYTITYTVNPPNGCNAVAIGTQITISPLPTVLPIVASGVCSGSVFEVDLNSAIAGTTYNWTAVQTNVTGAANGSAAMISNTLTATGNTPGTVVYSVIPTSADGCLGSAYDFTVNVYPLPVVHPEDGVICVKQSTNATERPYTIKSELDNFNYHFAWYFNDQLIEGQSANTLIADKAGVYTVIATHNITHCISEPASATVTASFMAETIDINGNTAFDENATITVILTGPGEYEYQLDYGPFQTSNVFRAVGSGVHEIHIRDAENCTNLSKEFTVIGFPHYFTPNNDGYNDRWEMRGLTAESRAKITIFDRYGKLMKIINSETPNWDGTIDGYLLPADDYWFIVDYYEKNIHKEFKSHFSLKR